MLSGKRLISRKLVAKNSVRFESILAFNPNPWTVVNETGFLNGPGTLNMEVKMRVVRRESRTPYLVDTLRKDVIFAHLVNGAASSDAMYGELLKHLTKLSEHIVSNEKSPKK